MPFKPGVSGNPNGRKRGYRPAFTKRRLTEALEGSNGDLEARTFLRRIVASTKCPIPWRMQAAGLLLPYEESRKTAREITKPLDLPAPASIEQATANIARLGALGAAKQLALDEMNDLINCQRAFIESTATTDTENRLRAIEAALQNHDIRPSIDISVEGGMPRLPGTSVLGMLGSDPDHEGGDE